MPPIWGQPAAEGTCLKFVEQQLQDLGGGHRAVDPDVGDRAVSRCEHRCLSTEGPAQGQCGDKDGH